MTFGNPKGQAILEAIFASTLAIVGTSGLLLYLLVLCLKTSLGWQLRKYILCEVSLPANHFCKQLTENTIQKFFPKLKVKISSVKKSNQFVAYAHVHLSGQFQLTVQETFSEMQFEK